MMKIPKEKSQNKLLMTSFYQAEEAVIKEFFEETGGENKVDHLVEIHEIFCEKFRLKDRLPWDYFLLHDETEIKYLTIKLLLW